MRKLTSHEARIRIITDFEGTREVRIRKRKDGYYVQQRSIYDGPLEHIDRVLSNWRDMSGALYSSIEGAERYIYLISGCIEKLLEGMVNH